MSYRYIVTLLLYLDAVNLQTTPTVTSNQYITSNTTSKFELQTTTAVSSERMSSVVRPTIRSTKKACKFCH